MRAHELRKIADQICEERRTKFEREKFLSMMREMEERAHAGLYDYECEYNAYGNSKYNIETVAAMLREQGYHVSFYEDIMGNDKVKVSWDE